MRFLIFEYIFLEEHYEAKEFKGIPKQQTIRSHSRTNRWTKL